MKLGGSRTERTWLWLGIPAVLSVALIATWALYVEQKSVLASQHTYDLIISTDELLSNLASAETWALGYVWTKDPAYARLYAGLSGGQGVEAEAAGDG